MTKIGLTSLFIAHILCWGASFKVLDGDSSGTFLNVIDESGKYTSIDATDTFAESVDLAVEGGDGKVIHLLKPKKSLKDYSGGTPFDKWLIGAAKKAGIELTPDTRLRVKGFEAEKVASRDEPKPTYELDPKTNIIEHCEYVDDPTKIHLVTNAKCPEGTGVCHATAKCSGSGQAVRLGDLKKVTIPIYFDTLLFCQAEKGVCPSADKCLEDQTVETAPPTSVDRSYRLREESQPANGSPRRNVIEKRDAKEGNHE